MDNVNKLWAALRKERHALDRERNDLGKERDDLRAEREQLRNEREALRAEREAIAKEWEQLKKINQAIDLLKGSGETSPTASGRKQSRKNSGRKITKAEIGVPSGFKHVTHFGWNLDGDGLLVENLLCALDSRSAAVVPANDVQNFDRSPPHIGARNRAMPPILTAPTELPPPPPVRRSRCATVTKSMDVEAMGCPARSRFSSVNIADDRPAQPSEWADASNVHQENVKQSASDGSPAEFFVAGETTRQYSLLD